ncbi:MAG: permease [Clostridia bacterium]
MLNLLKETIIYVIGTLIHNAPVLAFGILVAAAITVYVDPERLRQMLMKRAGVSITGSVAFGVFTPFCACGTMAVIVSMMTTALPWGPIMAFLTSSPLMSPDEFILYSGIINVKFAVALTVASVVIGICSGYITHFIEKNTKLLENQARFAGKKTCCGSNAIAEVGCCSQDNAPAKAKNLTEKYKLKELFKVFYKVGVKQVLVYFAVFAAASNPLSFNIDAVKFILAAFFFFPVK